MKSLKKATLWRKEIFWWAYVLIGISLVCFVAPMLISIADTFAVLLGIALLVGYGRWTWSLWLRALIDKAKQEF